MTDEPALPPPNSDANPPAVSSTSPLPPRMRADVDPAPKRDLLPVLYVVGFVVLAGSLIYLWQNPQASPLATQESGRVDTLQTQIAALRDQVTKLSEKPAGPSTADFTKLQQQVGALDGRPVVAPAAVAALSEKVGALESRPAVAPDTVQALAGKVTALEAKPAVDPAAVTQLSDKIATLEARKIVTPEQLSLLSDQVQAVGRQIPDIAPLTQRLTALDQRPTFDPAKMADLASKLQQSQDAETKLGARLDTAEKQASAQTEQLKALTQKAQITARLQGMGAALAAGQKLGDIPGAPPALARFANEAPPTEASLRESFERYADAAQKASQPAITANQDFGARLWTRAQKAVTVRQGDRVLVGDPIAGVIAHAHDKLENGDLAGSVEALKGLAGPAATAMQPWTEKAQSLVAARLAIASLAAN